MSSITLAQAAPLTQDLLLRGVIQNIVTVDRLYELLPFKSISGSALAYNRELVIGDSAGVAVGGTIGAKAAATVTAVTSALKSLIGDVEINQLVAQTQSNINDQTGFQIGSKAKSVGRLFQNYMVNGVESTSQFDGMLSLVDAGQVVASTETNGDLLSFAGLDELLDQVTDKDGEVDFIAMTSRELRSYYTLLRALGGASIGEVITLPSGVQIPAYRGTGIFRNDWIPVNGTKGTSTNTSTVIAGNFDDGSGTIGITGLTAESNFGIHVEDAGVHSTKDEHIWRVKMYAGMALYSLKGLATLDDITPSGA